MSTSLIAELREKTGAAILNCRDALRETNNNFDDAIQWLRKKGLSAAAKKSSRTAAQGLVAVRLSSDNRSGSLIEINSETDFVALNEGFQKLVEEISNHSVNCNNIETLNSVTLASGRSVKDEIVEHIASIGENLLLRKMHKLEVTNGVISSYIHNAVNGNMGKIAVLVALESETENKEALNELGKRIAMHIAAAKPIYLRREDVPSEAIEKEKSVFVDQCKASGKPDNIIANMIQGKLNNFFKEVVLLDQLFVMDNKLSVAEVIKNAASDLKSDVKLSAFVKFELGEGVEVEQTDFAKDVESIVNQTT